jgi:hypothetical protein
MSPPILTIVLHTLNILIGILSITILALVARSVILTDAIGDAYPEDVKGTGRGFLFWPGVGGIVDMLLFAFLWFRGSVCSVCITSTIIRTLEMLTIGRPRNEQRTGTVYYLLRASSSVARLLRSSTPGSNGTKPARIRSARLADTTLPSLGHAPQLMETVFEMRDRCVRNCTLCDTSSSPKSCLGR